MSTELTYTCDECKTRLVMGNETPRWWNLYRQGLHPKAEERDAKNLNFCSVPCLKAWVDRRFLSDRPRHFFVREQTHSQKGFYLCAPTGAIHERSDTPSTSMKEDVTCAACLEALKAQEVDRKLRG